MKVYVYKMTVDNGGAPCVMDGLLSLAICKPAIRRVAEKGSLLFGFAGNIMAKNYPGNRLIYAAKITHTVRGQEYYMPADEHKLRGDQIYRFDDGVLVDELVHNITNKVTWSMIWAKQMRT